MAEKRYYWIQLKDEFFKQKEIKKLRKIAGGDTYTIIYLKMLLLAVKQDNKLFFEGVEDSFAGELALELDEDSENVKVTLSFLEKQGLIKIISEDEFCLLQGPQMVGSESESAARVRRYRERKALQCNNDVTPVLQNGNTDIDIESEKELELEKNIIVDLSVKPSQKPSEKYPIGDFEFQCVEVLIKSCIDLFPNSKIPRTEEEKRKWALEIERMKRLDFRSEVDIMEALIFATTDSFWKPNIRSMKKFREKFETLIVQSRAKGSNQQGRVSEKYQKRIAELVKEQAPTIKNENVPEVMF